MRILIAIPSYDRRVDIDVARGLVLLERDRYDFDLVLPVSSHISRNRNLAVHDCLRGNYDWLLFWDSDIGIDDGFLGSLLETAWRKEAQIVCGCYKIKDKEAKYVLGIQRPDGTYENITEINEPQEVDAGGTGIMLIHRKVLETLKEPWFTIIDGQNLFTMPEDFEFCRKAKEAGFRIVADTRFGTRHYGLRAWEHGGTRKAS